MSIREPIDDRICNILHKHNVTQSVEEIRKTCIDPKGCPRIHASDLVIVIKPQQEVMHIGSLGSFSYTHSLWDWDMFDAETFPHEFIEYTWWLDHLRPALFEAIELLESPASEPTLEEQPDHSPESPEDETVIQLRKQVEELQGRLHNFESNLETKKERFDWLAIYIDEHDRKINELGHHRQEMSEEKEILEKEIDVMNYRFQKESLSDS